MIENESDGAAVIVEPVVGTNGVLVPPPEYMPKLRRICDDHEVLLIADEVMTGWGRTGRWFAMEHWVSRPISSSRRKGSRRPMCRWACVRQLRRSPRSLTITSSRMATPTRPTR